MELSLEASRYSLGYAAFEAAYLGSYELLFASVYSAPLDGPIALVPPGAATSPVMLGNLIDSGQEGGRNAAQINFDASRSSSFYSASNTVQPASLRFLACIKF